MLKFLVMFQHLANLRFLPSKLQRWLLHNATRVVEFISASGLFGYAVVFFLDGESLYTQHIYHKFQENIPLPLLVLILTATALLQIWAMVKCSPKSNVMSGGLLIWSGILWSLLMAAFVLTYPPANTGIVFPAIMTFVCYIAGNNLVDFGIVHVRRNKANRGG